MGDVVLPANYNYAEAYLTLRCDLGCSYCINNQSGVKRNVPELSANEWARALNRIDFKDVPITFGGGEPTLHREFYDILRLLDQNKRVDLLTDLSFNIDEFIKRTNHERFNKRPNPAYKSIRVSHHAERMDAEELMVKVRRLQDANFSIGVFGINHPMNTESNMQMSEIARKAGVYFFIKDFLGEYQGQTFGFFKYPDGINNEKRKVMCKTSELLIAPDGNIYKCHRDLYHSDSPIGNITAPKIKLEEKSRECSNFGECNPCDVKSKTNRFLNMGSCAVEIKNG